MRFMIIVKATAVSESGALPDESLMAPMATFHEELARAGVLLDASGLQPSSKGWRIRYKGGKRHVVDGPFAETKELVAGYTLIQVRSREEAQEWTRRFPAPMGDAMDCEIEVRQLYELDDFEPQAFAGPPQERLHPPGGPGEARVGGRSPAVARFRALEHPRPEA